MAAWRSSRDGKQRPGEMEIDTDSGLARSALTMWRRRTLYILITYTRERRSGEATRTQAAAGALVCYPALCSRAAAAEDSRTGNPELR